MVESTLPSFKELLDGSRLSTDDVDIIQDDCQLPSQTDTTPIVTSTNLYIAPMTRHSPQGHLTESTFEHISGRKALKITASGNSNTPRRDSCHWQGQGCSHVLFPSKDQLEHDALPHKDPSSSDRALPARENHKCRRLMGTLEEIFPCGKTRQRISRHDVLSMGDSSITMTGSSASSQTPLRAEPSVGRTSLQRPTLNTDNSDVDQLIQHKVGESKDAHKKAEQKRRNEGSSLITELEHCQSTLRLKVLLVVTKSWVARHISRVFYSLNLPCDSHTISKEVTLTLRHAGLPPEFLQRCQPRNQNPGYKKNGTLKALPNYHRHQAKVIEEQDRIIKAQTAANEALKEENVTFRRTNDPGNLEQ